MDDTPPPSRTATLGDHRLAAAGGALTLAYLWKGTETMEGQHWVMLLVLFVVGYVLGRLWAAPAKLVGLP